MRIPIHRQRDGRVSGKFFRVEQHHPRVDEFGDEPVPQSDANSFTRKPLIPAVNSSIARSSPVNTRVGLPVVALAVLRQREQRYPLAVADSGVRLATLIDDPGFGGWTSPLMVDSGKAVEFPMSR
jgi:hypothetical protein